MVKKRGKTLVRNSRKKSLSEVENIEKWIMAKRKFLKKLAWILGLVILLIILSFLFG